MRQFLGRMTLAIGAASWIAAVPEAQAEKPKPKETESMSLRGDQEGTAFRSLTVEGEDRVHFEIERPSLDLSLDPTQAPGLDWGDAHDVLDRTVPDGVAPFLAGSTSSMTPYLGRPWLRGFASGDVARFRPQLENIDRWRLLIADSRGQEVRSFEGHGKPPREITWDGRTASGEPAAPGLTYSYVLEARDKAGNKRNFVGQGFQLPAYRLPGPLLSFAGDAGLATSVRSTDAMRRTASPLVLEAASWLNQVDARQPVRIVVTAPSFERANALGNGIAASLTPLLLGSPSRVQVQARVQPDAGENGTVQIAAVRDKSAATVAPTPAGTRDKRSKK